MVRGGGIIFGCCVGGTDVGLCTLRDCKRDKLGVRESGGDFTGALGDDAEVNVINDSIGGREIACLCCKSGEGVKGGYMFAKTCESCFSTACCALPAI